MMDTSYAESELTIDLGAVAANYSYLRDAAQPAICGAVVKANAYGLGVAHIVPALAKQGCRHFFTAHLGEAVDVRNLMSDVDLYVFHGLRAGQESTFVAYGITPVLNCLAQVALWQTHARQLGRALPAIVHVDTGINRLGICPLELRDALSKNPALLEGIEVRYLMSHLACISQPDHPMNQQQLEAFQQVRSLFPGVPCTISNSGGVIVAPAYHLDMVRAGSGLYGVHSVRGVRAPLQSVVHLAAPIMHLQQVKQAGTVGYGATKEIAAGSWLATVPVGYADGYIRSLSNHAQGMLGGVLVPQVGRISMDMTVFDVTQVPAEHRQLGAKMELLNDTLTVDVLANAAGTIGYEILTNLGARYKRHYING